MIRTESDTPPEQFEFDLAIAAVGYERRCRYSIKKYGIKGRVSLGLEFGFLTSHSYPDNRQFFLDEGFQLIVGMGAETSKRISDAIISYGPTDRPTTVFVDISSMSREMISHVLLGLQTALGQKSLVVSAAYAPSKFSGAYQSAPIRRDGPIVSKLAGWSSRPDYPLGVIFGLGCEPNLALGALQLLEPRKAWLFEPVGTDPNYDEAMRAANSGIGDIFDVTSFAYDITRPTMLRGRFEALLNAVESDFRLVVVPFGPKIFAWSTIFTVALGARPTIGVWAFSSKDQATPVDRDSEGDVVWHQTTIDCSVL
ncbi:hypothetical protein YH63_007175 [Afipia massiliensis]|uniref:Uncharacterized protein n=1 Tax=Afipia massiliensis TaxID=211460 RepID=A0A4U6BLT9_9BRAD|nr:hypothetical protein [Afipia massiliensis]TKT71206.1 hypothetical protein YH63_007175 [Afipia massiliensis]